MLQRRVCGMQQTGILAIGFDYNMCRKRAKPGKYLPAGMLPRFLCGTEIFRQRQRLRFEKETIRHGQIPISAWRSTA